METAKRNTVDPQAWLIDALGRIADHKITRLNQHDRDPMSGSSRKAAMRVSVATDSASAQLPREAYAKAFAFLADELETR